MRQSINLPASLAWFALFLSALGLAAPAAAQGNVENAPDSYIHNPTNIALPENIAGFKRNRVVEFDAAGSNAGFVYRPTDRAGEITLYIYPKAGRSCQDEFSSADSAIVKRGGSVLNRENVLSIGAFAAGEQLSRSYMIEPGGYGFEHGELASFLWVACPVDSKFVVKYRASYPVSDAARNIGLEQKLFGAIDWSPITSE